MPRGRTGLIEGRMMMRVLASLNAYHFPMAKREHRVMGWSSIATTIVIPIYYVPALGRCQSPLAKQLSNSLSLSKYFSGNPIFSSLTVDLEVPVYFSRRAVEISQSDKSNQRFLRKYGGGIHSRRTMKSLSYIGVGIAWHKLTTL
ncbi:hypothetical protein MTR_1g064280 [Medicago truncatula]|uniref:Uncharacterized protein n=1 Tax=Medicago truncatula TaxID=3880 RepID=G7IBJ9_MEDTR|nr:hypothetical protein MTR_1g064280 [Medicago truncatula]